MARARVRKLTVDDIDYQWVVRPLDPGHVVVRVWRRGPVRHRQLEVRVAFDDPWLNYGPIITTPQDRRAEVFDLTPVTSALVARLVRLGLAAGWESESRGQSLRFDLDGTRERLTPVEHTPG
ncbi:hypothetical protein [Kribbella sp. CA-294648]|uniref:hypothetical protein n=1 Tax=Kribbella sp. CA-294648 TaxID=3239948 RepID=UPI003D92C2B1